MKRHVGLLKPGDTFYLSGYEYSIEFVLGEIKYRGPKEFIRLLRESGFEKVVAVTPAKSDTRLRRVYVKEDEFYLLLANQEVTIGQPEKSIVEECVEAHFEGLEARLAALEAR